MLLVPRHKSLFLWSYLDPAFPVLFPLFYYILVLHTHIHLSIYIYIWKIIRLENWGAASALEREMDSTTGHGSIITVKRRTTRQHCILHLLLFFLFVSSLFLRLYLNLIDPYQTAQMRRSSSSIRIADPAAPSVSAFFLPFWLRGLLLYREKERRSLMLSIDFAFLYLGDICLRFRRTICA